MSSINKQSVREEASRIKAEFEQLSLNHKINSETKMLFQSMLILLNLLISIFLEKSTRKNNKNSSKPSSQTEKDESSILKKKTNDKGKDESHLTVNNTRVVENITLAKVEQCDVCGQDLSKTASQQHERRTKIDIIFEKVIEHVDAEIKYCSHCDSPVKGTFPSDMPGSLQYGSGLKAYIINLSTY